jgi:hypothetical protein
MNDIVKMLEGVDHMSVEDCFLQSPLFAKAAAEITRLRSDLEKAREALKFYAIGDWNNECPGGIRIRGEDGTTLDFGDCAAATLKEIDNEQHT